MIINKQEFFKLLYENEALKSAMKQIKNDKELRTTKAAIEEIVGQFYDGIMSTVSTIQKDPEAFKKAVTEHESSLINEEGSVKKTESNG